MQSYECTACDYIYDPEKGDMDNGVAPGTAFEVYQMTGFAHPVAWTRISSNQ